MGRGMTHIERPLGAFHAAAGRGQGLEAFRCDQLPTAFAASVGAVIQATESALHFSYCLLCLHGWRFGLPAPGCNLARIRCPLSACGDTPSTGCEFLLEK